MVPRVLFVFVIFPTLIKSPHVSDVIKYAPKSNDGNGPDNMIEQKILRAIINGRSSRSIVKSKYCEGGLVHLPPPIDICGTKEMYNQLMADDYIDYTVGPPKTTIEPTNAETSTYGFYLDNLETSSTSSKLVTQPSLSSNKLDNEGGISTTEPSNNKKASTTSKVTNIFEDISSTKRPSTTEPQSTTEAPNVEHSEDSSTTAKSDSIESSYPQLALSPNKVDNEGVLSTTEDSLAPTKVTSIYKDVSSTKGPITTEPQSTTVAPFADNSGVSSMNDSSNSSVSSFYQLFSVLLISCFFRNLMG